MILKNIYICLSKKAIEMTKNYIALLLLIFAYACTQCGKSNGEINEAKLSKDDMAKTSVFNIRNALFSIPSPHQLTKILIDKKLEFRNDILNPLSNYKNYQTSFKKALNLGIYGANFGYLNLFDRTQETIRYFSVIKILSEDLNLLGAIKQDVLTRIENNLSNKDSLMYYITTSYQDIDIYLKKNQQETTGALILAGGWIESMYFLSEYAKKTNDPELISRLWENKKALENLITILSEISEQNNNFEELLNRLNRLYELFETIEIKTQLIRAEHFAEEKFSRIDSELKASISIKQSIELFFQLEKLREFCIQ